MNRNDSTNVKLLIIVLLIYGVPHYLMTKMLGETMFVQEAVTIFEAIFWCCLILYMRHKQMLRDNYICIPQRTIDITIILWVVPFIQLIIWGIPCLSITTFFHCLFAAIGEELLFRAVIPNYINNHICRSFFSCSIISSAIFAGVHLINLFSGGSLYFSFLQVLYAFCGGMALFCIVERQKSIVMCSLLHFCINLTSFSQGEDVSKITIGAVVIFSVIFMLVYCRVLTLKREELLSDESVH